MSLRTVLLSQLRFGFAALLPIYIGRATAQAVSRRPPTAEARVQSWGQSMWDLLSTNGTGTGLSPSTSVSPVHFFPPVLQYLENDKNNHLQIRIKSKIPIKITAHNFELPVTFHTVENNE
jgi:hypothetical protein